MSEFQQDTVREYDGLTVTWGEEEEVEELEPLSSMSVGQFLLIFAVLAALIVPVTILVTRYFSIIHQVHNPVNAGRQSLEALELVESHVGDYLQRHGQMPQYVGLRQLGVEPQALEAFPLIRAVSVLGGSAADKQWTSVKARIRSDIASPIAGYNVVMELEALLDQNGKPIGKFMSSCYVRGRNNQKVSSGLEYFPRRCQKTRPT
ncbi:MAG: hypothetical protein ACWA5X_14155 [bacterium]